MLVPENFEPHICIVLDLKMDFKQKFYVSSLKHNHSDDR